MKTLQFILFIVIAVVLFTTIDIKIVNYLVSHANNDFKLTVQILSWIFISIITIVISAYLPKIFESKAFIYFILLIILLILIGTFFK